MQAQPECPEDKEREGIVLEAGVEVNEGLHGIGIG